MTDRHDAGRPRSHNRAAFAELAQEAPHVRAIDAPTTVDPQGSLTSDEPRSREDLARISSGFRAISTGGVRSLVLIAIAMLLIFVLLPVALGAAAALAL
jgi:hypothetical protein